MLHQPHLIIAGTTKAATTSVFQYLKDHPGICAASLKETRFFLDPGYPVPVTRLYPKGTEDYAALFRHGGAGVRLEATPDYLYSMGTPVRMRRVLSDVRLVFILRNPLTRLQSWYRFSRQNGVLDRGVSYDAYVRTQLDSSGRGASPQHLRALEQGCYGRYLRVFLKHFHRERILVVFYEDLARDPKTVMTGICRFASLDPGYFDGFDFAVHNRTRTPRYPGLHRRYKSLRDGLRRKTRDQRRLRGLLRRINRALEPVYLHFNDRSEPPVALPSATEDRLWAYYRPHVADLNDLLGSSAIPWPEWKAGAANLILSDEVRAPHAAMRPSAEAEP